MDLPLKRLGSYLLGEIIASGGMASIYSARHEKTGAEVAIKILKRRLRGRQDPLARILQEGRVICSLLHENIVRVLDYGIADEDLGFVIMERLQGHSLGEILEQEGALEPQRVAFIARQICQGLSAAHARGIFHRDIKPDNLMLVQGQRHRDFIKILDFGIAKLEVGDPAKMAATATGMTLGTPLYMSPEQAQALKIDARSDIYQLGLILYELLAGSPPFFHKSPVQLMRMHLQTPPPPLRERVPALDPELERLIHRCLEKRPEERYGSAEELREVLDLWTGRNGVEQTCLKLGGEAPLLRDLRLPTLGNPGDLQRYARNLDEVLKGLWPEEEIPEELRVIQGAMESLRAKQLGLDQSLAEARDAADRLARSLEARLSPLERAIRSLSEEKDKLLEQLEVEQEQVEQLLKQIENLDADYAQIYGKIEAHQSTLFSSTQAGGLVDFRDLYREDIEARLRRLERIFKARRRETERLNALKKQLAAQMPRVADMRYQLAELEKSRLSIQAERNTSLAGQEFQVADLEDRRRALERAIEHRSLQLGLSFRRAISRLLER